MSQHYHYQTGHLNRVYISGDLLRIDVVGDQTGSSVKAMGQQIEALICSLRASGKEVLILDNVKHIGKANTEAMRNVAILARILDYDKAAMVGDGSAIMRKSTNLLLATVGRSNTRYFDTIKAAEEWLRL